MYSWGGNQPLQDTIHNVTPDAFMSSVVPLYSGPQVTIRLEVEDDNVREYKLPKGLLCKQSPYFAAMFEGKFREGEEQAVTLPPMEGVISVRSFETLVQYLHLGFVVYPEAASVKEIDHLIEFARFVDMCGITQMNDTISSRLREAIRGTPQQHQCHRWGTPVQTTSRESHVTIKHISAAAALPYGHPVRRIVAETVVGRYLQREEGRHWKKVCREVPGFGLDLLEATQDTMNTVHAGQRDIHFQDPITHHSSVLDGKTCHCACPGPFLDNGNGNGNWGNCWSGAGAECACGRK
ncbi:hypothetical protein LOCC1_G006239 [Lachnellula occidentalis]|uniref:BTB domain-containing protein n=1 Tax=Lachnellula occidentalis TaxID=215460 RepID=A0A8H8RR05_9HELO|nr:hypothetical protein LOCC1_G006239 [Lachnellula occidentalis]